jgi:hypothetical protein
MGRECGARDVQLWASSALAASVADVARSPRLDAVADLGGIMLPGTPVDFGKLVADETEKWGKVVKFAGLKLA